MSSWMFDFRIWTMLFHSVLYNQILIIFLFISRPVNLFSSHFPLFFFSNVFCLRLNNLDNCSREVSKAFVWQLSPNQNGCYVPAKLISASVVALLEPHNTNASRQDRTCAMNKDDAHFSVYCFCCSGSFDTSLRIDWISAKAAAISSLKFASLLANIAKVCSSLLVYISQQFNLCKCKF